MTNQKPITPPSELVQQWLGNYFGRIISGEPLPSEKFLATQAARWGADQELDQCVEWLISNEAPTLAAALQAGRRPKSKSLAEQKQAIHDEIHQLLEQISASNAGALAVAEPIRAALERLRELEGNQ